MCMYICVHTCSQHIIAMGKEKCQSKFIKLFSYKKLQRIAPISPHLYKYFQVFLQQLYLTAENVVVHVESVIKNALGTICDAQLGFAWPFLWPTSQVPCSGHVCSSKLPWTPEL